MCEMVLAAGNHVRFHARGASMQPSILDGDVVEIAPVSECKIRKGLILLVSTADGLKLHRVVRCNNSEVLTRGDAGRENDLTAAAVIGVATAVTRNGKLESLQGRAQELKQKTRSFSRRIRLAAARRLHAAQVLHLLLFAVGSLLAMAGFAPTAAAQNVDISMTQSVTPTSVIANQNLTYTEVVTNNGPGSAATATLSQQTPANTTFVSITAPGTWTCSNPGVGNSGQILCNSNAAFANGATASFTIVVKVVAGTAAGTQIQNSANATSTSPDPDPTNNATLTVAYVEVSGNADVSITQIASPNPVYVSSSLTFSGTVQNFGIANATNTTITDILPAGVTYVSATASQGSCSQASGTVTCLLGTVNANASATYSIVVTSPTTATALSNTTSVSATQTDPYTTNNSDTESITVQALACSTPGKDTAGGTLTGTVNTYFPPNATMTLNPGDTSVALGAASGATTPIAIGDRLLIIQMQGADIDSTQTGSYGDGIPGDPGSGANNLRSAGLFEYVTATNAVAVAGGTLNFVGAGSGGGLLNTYENSPYTTTGTDHAQRRFQVIRVPQYSTATLSSTLTALAWTGSVGGVLALDTSGTLTLGGTVSVNGLGFRGGAGRQLAGDTGGSSSDYRTVATKAYHGSKGEGYAGTPRYMANNAVSAVVDNTVEGYVNGSYARGATGNAGGGGADGNPGSNDQNSGGGGGGNGGYGGQGGYSWSSSSNAGGFGGASFSATPGRIVAGGGGGAGTTNNGTADPTNTNTAGINSSGARGGGIVIIHAGSVSGTGTITANGGNALNVLNDGAGGGGAGGTIILLAGSGNLSGLTVTANGGNGGSCWTAQAAGAYPGERHGPGGGGGGGVVYLSSAPASVTVTGGTNGKTTTSLDAFGSTSGLAGIAVTNVAAPLPGAQSGGGCATSDLAVTNSGTPSVVTPGSNITYTQTVTNNGPQSSVNAIFSEAIPANTTFQSLSVPAGWTCTTPAVNGTGNVNCTNPLVANGATASFTLVVKVNAGTTDQTQITDVASVTSSTTDPNLTNNTATVVTVVSLPGEADLTVTNVATPNPVAANANISYTQVVRNLGPSAAATVSFTETTPANTTFVSMATPAGWSCSTPASGGTGTITCTIASLASGATATFSPILKVVAGTAPGTVITDTTSVTSATTDPNPTSNSASASVIVAGATQADLAVTATASPNPVLAGNNITYTQTVTNNGPATAATNTFTETIPANTTFQSLAVPSGWVCTTPAVNATGTITCTAATFAANATASFPLVVKVNSGTAPGTTITLSPTVSSVTGDPNSANNSTTATTVVASPSQADVAISKTASPEPVDQNTNLVYTLQVTNNGPATATGVTVSDPLPAQVTFSSVSTTQGTCSQSAGTVTCNLGSIVDGGLVIVTINVNAATFSSASLASNTATVSTTASDPNLTNNTSTVSSTIQSPTAVQLISFRAFPQQNGSVKLEWRTREEVRNLGFNVYREDATGRHKLNPSIIAGSALILRRSLPQHGAKTYQWLDDSAGAPNASYWIEDVDLSGARNSHGPAILEATEFSQVNVSAAPLLKHINQLKAMAQTPAYSVVETPDFIPSATANLAAAQKSSLDDRPAVKISIQQDGWYRVTQSQLVAAGMDPRANARTLQLFAEGVEQAIAISGNQDGSLGANSAIEFYGTGIDTPYSGTRVYWLVWGAQSGKRIVNVPSNSTGGSQTTSFAATALLRDRTTYFAALLNSEDQDNFFGATITSDPLDQDIYINHIAPEAAGASLDITLQGVVEGQPHSVDVFLNGSSLGTIQFLGQASQKTTFAIDPSALREGKNTVTLTALNGDDDVSLVDNIALHYSRQLVTDRNWLRMQINSGSRVQVKGFTSPQIRVYDITNPAAIEQVNGTIGRATDSYAVDFVVPGAMWSGAPHTLVAFTPDQSAAPDALHYHAPSRLKERQDGGSVLIVAHSDFVPALSPLVRLRENQGQSVKVVTPEEIFDAFNYGERSPYALRDFLKTASTLWRTPPQSILLVGDASLDPRNYLGFGDFDFVPTRMITTAALKTASDDWFTDFTSKGYGTIPTGRLPVRTSSEAELVVSKIVGYETGADAGNWNSQSLVVSDQNVGADFTSTANALAGTLSKSLNVTKILTNQQDFSVVKPQLLDAINRGQLIVNYVGHGSVEQWSFGDLFNADDASALQNGGKLPLFLMMNCLNGFFQDVYTQSLAESLLLAPNGGAVAVWASSGFTDAAPQAGMDQALIHILATNPTMPLGKAILLAKSQTADRDVRRTWVLFGDPAMKLKIRVAPITPARPRWPGVNAPVRTLPHR